MSRAPEPTFAILVPAYQAAETIGAALASAAAQTRPADEIVVCDDGSTDALDDALAPWRDSIVLVRKENGGGASALNAAARAASSDFVAILDADDTYEPRRLEALAELAAERPDLDILATDAYLEVGGEIVGRFSDQTPFAHDDQRLAILRTCFIGGWPAIRRTTLLAAGGFDESIRIPYDWECWIRLLFRGARAGYVGEPLLTYRLHEGGVTADRKANLRARIAMLERVRRMPLSSAERKELEHTLVRERQKLGSVASPVRRALARVRGVRRA
jgi:glycosyltransferase involved in cell wall biosynthesis